MQGPLKALHLHGEIVTIRRVLHRLSEEWSADGHLIIFISAAGGEMIGVAQRAAFLEVMVMVDVVLNKALVPVIPLALCWNSLPYCIDPVSLFVLLPAVNMSYIEEQLVPAVNCLPGDFCVPAALGSGEHEDAWTKAEQPVKAHCQVGETHSAGMTAPSSSMSSGSSYSSSSYDSDASTRFAGECRRRSPAARMEVLMASAAFLRGTLPDAASLCPSTASSTAQRTVPCQWHAGQETCCLQTSARCALPPPSLCGQPTRAHQSLPHDKNNIWTASKAGSHVVHR